MKPNKNETMNRKQMDCKQIDETRKMMTDDRTKTKLRKRSTGKLQISADP